MQLCRHASLRHHVWQSSNAHRCMCVTQEALSCRSHRIALLISLASCCFLPSTLSASSWVHWGKNVVSPWREEAKGRRLLCHFSVSLWLFAPFFLVSPCLESVCFKNPIRAKRLDTLPPAYLSLCFLSGIDHYDWHALTQNKSENHCPFVSRARKAGEWCETYLLLKQILNLRLKVPWALLLNVFSSCTRKYGLQFNMTQVH